MADNQIRYKSGCVVCGEPLQYFLDSKKMICEHCKKEFEANCSCESGHYICDSCHSQGAFKDITACSLESSSKNPISIATEMMGGNYINMHGPEHHYLVAAALLTAYKNSGGDIDLEACLKKAQDRAKNVPGGICGMWGSCGAGIATGIFISIITGASSLSVREWSLANQMTSESLLLISKNGGPRCCKRNTYLATLAAIDFVSKQFGIEMEKQVEISCNFHPLNKHCRRKACIFWTKE